MIGVAPLRLGIGTFQAMLSPVAVDHFTGSPFSAPAPVASGPRHCGQFSAETVARCGRTYRERQAQLGWHQRRLLFLNVLT